MENQEIKRILIDKGIEQLYHANTVATACTFIENNGLLSRGAIRDKGLYQTWQKSDDSDEEFDVFYDIFFDSVDIHQRIKGVNFYGPVVFVYSIDVLDVLPSGCIQITKENPIHWTSTMADKDKYFSTEEEVRNNYRCGEFKQHFTLRHQDEPLSFEYLEKIVIDNPGLEDNQYFEEAYQHLQNLINKYNPSICLEARACSSECHCKAQYKNQKKKYLYNKFYFE